MDLIVSLIRRDLMTMPRRRRFYIARLLFAVGVSLIVVIAFLQGAYTNASTAGLGIFHKVGLVMTVAACLLAPQVAASALVQERQSRVIALLFLSELKPWQLVTSKLVSAMVRTLLTQLVVLPLVILCVSMGGVSTGQIVTALLLLLSAIFAGNCVGLLAATLGRTEMRVNNYGAIGMVLLYVLLPLVASQAAAWFPWAKAQWALYVSPLLAMLSLIHGDSPLEALRAAGVLAVIGFVVLAVVFAVLPWRIARDIRETPSTSQAPHLAEHPWVRRWLGRPGLLGNPVFWREYYIVYGGTGAAWFQFVIGLLATVGTVVVIGVLIDLGDPASVAIFALGALGVVCAVYYFIGFTSSAARMFSRDRENGSLELLLCTDLDEEAIVSGKARSIYVKLYPWLLGLIVSLVGLVVLRHDWVFILKLLVVVAYVLLTWTAYSGITFFLALRFNRFVQMMAFAVLVLWLTLGTSLLVGVSVFLFFIGGFFGPLIMVAGPMAVGVISRGMVKRNLRRFVMMPKES